MESNRVDHATRHSPSGPHTARGVGGAFAAATTIAMIAGGSQAAAGGSAHAQRIAAPILIAHAAGALWQPAQDADHADEQVDPFAAAIEGFAVVNNNLDRSEPTLFRIYREDDRVLAVIPEELLGELWLLGASMAAGPFGTGEQLGQAGLEWRKRGEELDLFAPELRYDASSKPTLEPGVRNVFTDRYITSAPIIAEGDGGLLIDLTGFIGSAMGELVGSFIGSADQSVMRVEKIKAFNQNVELALSMPIQIPGGMWWSPVQSGQMQTLHFSFSALNDNPEFERRPADPRVGYWVHATRDMGRRDPLGTDFVRSIERWDLRKADPDAPLSAPVKPIVFYIEKTVPPAYRVHVRRGVEAWNEAFRAVGIENAIEVRQQTETQYAEIDPEDVRYNFIRWVPTGFGYAIALHRTDPRTGEILDADVVIDDAWINAWANEYPLLTQQAARARLDAMRQHHPELTPVAEHLTDRARRRGLITPEPDPEALARDPEAARGLSDRQRGDLLRRLIDRAEPGVLSHRHHAMCRCNFTERLGHSLAVAHLSAMVDRSMLAEEEAGESEAPTAFEIDGVPADLVADNIIALVAHEVGHVLGLRHNFAGSAWMSASAIDEYTDRAQEPPATSVMDYIGTFIAEPGKPQGVYNTVRVGAYDRWAIAYGYMHADEDELAEHLAMSVMPEHRYMTDEDVYSPDPTAMRYDFGSDPVEGRQRQFRRIDFLRQQLLDRLATENENWTKVTAAFNTLRFEEMMALWDTTGWIGGTYLSRDFNTPGAARPRRNVEPEIQRGVLDMIVQRLFSEDSLPIDRDLANSLQTVTWYDSTFPSFGGGPTDVDLLGNANMTQYFVLSDLMHLCTPRLANQELRTEPGANALTVPELHRTLTDSIWSEFTREPTQGSAYTNLNPKVSALRRGLQREHANQLIDLAYRMEFMPATMLSAQLVAIDQLRTIRDRLAAWTNDGELARSAGPLDDYTRIHITELLRMIDATLEAQVSRSP